MSPVVFSHRDTCCFTAPLWTLQRPLLDKSLCCRLPEITLAWQRQVHQLKCEQKTNFQQRCWAVVWCVFCAALFSFLFYKVWEPCRAAKLLFLYPRQLCNLMVSIIHWRFHASWSFRVLNRKKWEETFLFFNISFLRSVPLCFLSLMTTKKHE